MIYMSNSQYIRLMFASTVTMPKVRMRFLEMPMGLHVTFVEGRTQSVVHVSILTPTKCTTFSVRPRLRRRTTTRSRSPSSRVDPERSS
jgi:hypothetical protein